MHRCMLLIERKKNVFLNDKEAVSFVLQGHNGLVAAGDLQKAGYKVCVLERRHVIGKPT